MKNSIKFDVSDAKKADIYSMLLFVMFKTKDMKSCGSLPEMIYLLDKKNFLVLCEYFGGREIYIPTISELQEYLEALILFQRIDIDGIDEKKAISMIERGSSTSPYYISEVREKYGELKEVLNNYEFSKRQV